MIRAHQLYDKVSALLANNPSWSLYLVTLTRRNVGSADGMVDLLLKPWRLLRKSRDWKMRPWGKVPAAFWAFEFTQKGRGWHPHMHALIAGPEGVTSGLVGQWCEVVGPDANADAQSVEVAHGIGAVVEVCKYVAKSVDLSAQQLREAEEAVVGRHLRGTFGALRGLTLDGDGDDCTDANCPVCGGLMTEQVMGLRKDGVTYSRIMVDMGGQT